MAENPEQCERCRAPLAQNFQWCPHCGAHQRTQPRLTSTPARIRDMVCAKCGMHFPSSFDDCPACESRKRMRPLRIGLLVIALVVGLLTVVLNLTNQSRNWLNKSARPSVGATSQGGGLAPITVAPPEPSEAELPKSYGLYQMSGRQLLMLKTSPYTSGAFAAVPLDSRRPVFVWYGRGYQPPTFDHYVYRSGTLTDDGNFERIELQMTPRGQDMLQMEPYSDLSAGSTFRLSLYGPAEFTGTQVFWFTIP